MRTDVKLKEPDVRETPPSQRCGYSGGRPNSPVHLYGAVEHRRTPTWASTHRHHKLGHDQGSSSAEGEAGGGSAGSELVTSPRYVLGVRCACAADVRCAGGVERGVHKLPDGGRRPGLARRVGHLGSPAYRAPSVAPAIAPALSPPASSPPAAAAVNGSRRRASSLYGTSYDRGVARGVDRGVVLKRGVSVSTCQHPSQQPSASEVTLHSTSGGACGER